MAEEKPAETPATDTSTAAPADPVAVFNLTEKYLQKQIDSLTGTDDESSSMRGNLTTVLQQFRVGKPGGVSSL